MADLAKLYGAMNAKTPDIDGLVQQSVNVSINRILRGIKTGVEEQNARTERDKTEQIVSALNGVAPAIKQVVEEAVSAVLSELGKIESLDALKGMVKGIRIPDHTGHLAALEQAISNMHMPETDLKPVLKHLKEMAAKMEEKMEHEPQEWTFEVKRDEITKLIESVEVRSN